MKENKAMIVVTKDKAEKFNPAKESKDSKSKKNKDEKSEK